VRDSQRAMGARRTFGASIGEALQGLEPALAPPAIERWCGVRGCVCVPSRRPRAHATGRRALSLLLRGHMWAHLRKPPAGRSQRVGLVKRRGVRAVHVGCTARRREGGQASAGSRRDGCTRDGPGRGPRTPPTRSRTTSAIIRPAREGGRGVVRRGAVRRGVVRRGAWRGRGESGRPIRVELHSVHAARRLHNCRRLPRFHQLESRAGTRRRVLRVCCGCAARCAGEWGVPGGSRRLRSPHRAVHVSTGLEKITQSWSSSSALA
jgi:hypothetical protein